MHCGHGESRRSPFSYPALRLARFLAEDLSRRETWSFTVPVRCSITARMEWHSAVYTASGRSDMARYVITTSKGI